MDSCLTTSPQKIASLDKSSIFFPPVQMGLMTSFHDTLEKIDYNSTWWMGIFPDSSAI